MASVLVMVLGAAIPAGAANKHSAYKAEVEATKGTSAPTVGAHANKFCREKMERSALGEVVLPAGQPDQTPKNYR